MQIVGIDGGGTNTRAVAVDQAACLVGAARAGGGNFQALGLEGLEELLNRLWPRLGVQLPFEALCLGLAGAGRPAEQEAIAHLAMARGWPRQVRVVSDAQAALVGAHGGQAGLVVISGTGSMVLGRNTQGAQARAGGWGPLLEDEGSGYYLGMEGVPAALRARDGWGPATVLDQRLRQVLGLEDWDQIVRRVYSGELRRDEVAALGLEVMTAAQEGDECALAIAVAAGEVLGRQVGAVARKLGMGAGVEVAGVGGVFAARQLLWPAMLRGAAEDGCQLRWREPLLPPVLGAVLIAWEAAGLELDGEVVQALGRIAPEVGS